MKFLGIYLKQRIIQQAACWTGETECGCYAKDEEIPIKEDQCVLNLGTFPDVAGFWKFTFELKINSLPTEIDEYYNQGYPAFDWGFVFLSGIGSSITKFDPTLFARLRQYKSELTLKLLEIFEILK